MDFLSKMKIIDDGAINDIVTNINFLQLKLLIITTLVFLHTVIDFKSFWENRKPEPCLDTPKIYFHVLYWRAISTRVGIYLLLEMY